MEAKKPKQAVFLAEYDAWVVPTAEYESLKEDAWILADLRDEEAEDNARPEGV